jgi:hypothetical protein
MNASIIELPFTKDLFWCMTAICGISLVDVWTITAVMEANLLTLLLRSRHLLFLPANILLSDGTIGKYKTGISC